jgi:hypothetical protein
MRNAVVNTAMKLTTPTTRNQRKRLSAKTMGTVAGPVPIRAGYMKAAEPSSATYALVR